MRHKGFNTDDEIDEVLDPLLFAVTSLAGDGAPRFSVGWGVTGNTAIGRDRPGPGFNGGGYPVRSIATVTGHATVLNGGS